MYFTMEKLQCFNTFILLFTISIRLTNVVSCPVNCQCAGQTQGAVRCGSGLSSVPSGIPITVSSLSLSGLPSQHNTFTHLQQSNFQSFTNLDTLIIRYSEVKTIDDGAFAGLNNLRDLNLANNQLSALSGEHFRGLPKLRTVDVSGNHNCLFDKTLFAHIKDIEELNLGDMKLSRLSTDLFSELRKLKVLKLYSNDIVKIKPAVLAPLTLLQTLDLNGNLLKDLPKALKPMLNNLKSLHLSQNPWECHCQLYWFRELKHEFLINGIEGGEVICNGPTRVRYQSYLNVPDKEFICTPPNVLRCDRTKYSVDVHHSLSMYCAFEGSPVPEVKWIQPGGKEFVEAGTTSGQYTILDNGTLVINGVDKPDDGQWTFQVFNGTANDSITVQVEVTGIATTTLSTPSTSTPSTSTSTTSTSTTIKTTTSTTTTTTTTPTTVTSTTRPATTTKTSSTPTTTLINLTTSLRTLTTKVTSPPSSVVSPTKSSKTWSSSTRQRTTFSTQSTPTARTKIISMSPSSTLLAKFTVKSKPTPGTSVSQPSSPSPQAIKSTPTSGDTTQPDSAINIGLIAASGVGGGTLVGVCGIIIMCCKRKSNAEKSKIKPFDYDI